MSPFRERSDSTMKNVLGKIFVFAIFVMSLMLMSFAVAIYSSHVDWQKKAKETKETLDKVAAEKASLDEEITRLTENVATSEAARDQVIAKFQQALIEKDKELKTLKDGRDQKLAEMQQKISDLATVEDDLTQARKEVAQLQAEVNDKQQKVDTQVDRAAEIAGQLHEKESFLESLPKDRVPTINGVVMAVVDDSIEVSLGFDDGLQTGHQIEVYRNDEYLGRAIVKSVKPDRAVAVLVREYSRGIVQRGDKVTTRLKA